MSASPLSATIAQNIQNNQANPSVSAVSKAEKPKTRKEKFQEKYGLYEDKNHFLIAITTPLFDDNNAEMWVDVLPGISDMGFQMVVRANASLEYKAIAEAFGKDHIGLFAIIPEEDFEEIYEVADVRLCFTSNDEEVLEVKKSLKKGVIPISSAQFPLSTLENYNPNLESGNAFVYHQKSVWSLFSALIRAYENYRFPYDWNNIKKMAMKSGE